MVRKTYHNVDHPAGRRRWPYMLWGEAVREQPRLDYPPVCWANQSECFHTLIWKDFLCYNTEENQTIAEIVL